jgi:hypothetical protein
VPQVYRFRGSDLDEEKDQERLGGHLERVRTLMLDGQWRTIPEIAEATGCRMDATVSRMLRYLRETEFGAYRVDKRLRGRGLYEYRVLSPADERGQYQFGFAG